MPKLHEAIRTHDLERLAALLLVGVSTEERTPDGMTALLFCVVQRGVPYEVQLEMVRALLAAGADPAAVDDEQRTALHLAACHVTLGGYDEPTPTPLFEALVQAGCPTDARDASNRTPFDIAVYYDNGDALDCLSNVPGALESARPESVLLLAAKAGREELGRRALESGADANVRDSRHFTPLHWIASNGSWRSAEAQRQAHRLLAHLLAAGADIHARDREGRTPLDRAASRDPETARLLVDAEPDARDG